MRAFFVTFIAIIIVGLGMPMVHAVLHLENTVHAAQARVNHE